MKSTKQFRSIPIENLQRVIGKKVLISLKYDKLQYKGILKSVDLQMNVQLSQATEITESEEKELGDVLIRGSTILFVQTNEEDFE